MIALLPAFAILAACALVAWAVIPALEDHLQRSLELPDNDNQETTPHD